MPAPCNAAVRRRITIRTLMVAVLICSILFAFPRYWLFLIATATCLYLPLTAVAGLYRIIGRRGTSGAIGVSGMATRCRRPLCVLDPDDVGAPRGWTASIASAILVTAMLIGAWPILRALTSCLVVLAVNFPSPRTPRIVAYWVDLISRVGSDSWQRLWAWELISALHWWVLFGTFALILTPFRQSLGVRPRSFEGLLRMAPWLIVLDVGGLAFTYLLRDCEPEPATTFGSFWGWPARIPPLLQFWLLRIGLFLGAAGWIYFRKVHHLGVRASLMGVALLALTGAFWSIVSTGIWLELAIRGYLP